MNGANLNFTTGWIGIGTTNPTAPLRVVGTIQGDKFIGNGSTLTGVLKPSPAANQILQSGTSAATPLVIMGAVGQSVPIFKVENNTGVPYLHVAPGGGISVGTSTPTAALTVVGTVSASAFIGNGSALTGVLKPSPAANQILQSGASAATPLVIMGAVGQSVPIFKVENNTGVPYLHVAPGGGISVGTSTPTAALTVVGTVSASAFIGDGSALTGVLTNLPFAAQILQAGTNAITPLIVRSSTGQTPPVFLVEDFASNPLLAVNPGGALTVGTLTAFNMLVVAGTIEAFSNLVLGGTNPGTSALSLVHTPSTAFLHMAESSANPAGVPNAGRLFTKDVGGATELFYIGTNGAPVSQITKGAAINAAKPLWAEFDETLLVSVSSGAPYTVPGGKTLWLQEFFAGVASNLELVVSGSLRTLAIGAVSTGYTFRHPIPLSAGWQVKTNMSTPSQVLGVLTAEDTKIVPFVVNTTTIAANQVAFVQGVFNSQGTTGTVQIDSQSMRNYTGGSFSGWDSPLRLATTSTSKTLQTTNGVNARLFGYKRLP